MEIRISNENLLKALWMVSVALSAIGFLLTLYGLVVAMTLNEGARVQAATFPMTIIVAGTALTIIPWCLASSVSRLVDSLDRARDIDSEGDG